MTFRDASYWFVTGRVSNVRCLQELSNVKGSGGGGGGVCELSFDKLFDDI